MKTLLLFAIGLSCAVVSHAQTAPTAPATGSTPAVSGTKNVGSDRADAPQAPGMTTPGTTRSSTTRKSKSTSQRTGTTTKKSTAPASAQ